MPAQNSYNSATPADGDYVTGVDISDTTQSVSGSTASFLFSAISSYVRSAMLALANAWTAHQSIGADASPDMPYPGNHPQSYLLSLSEAFTSTAAYTGAIFANPTITLNGTNQDVYGFDIEIAQGGSVAGGSLFAGYISADYTGSGSRDNVYGLSIGVNAHDKTVSTTVDGLYIGVSGAAGSPQARGLVIDNVSGATANYALQTGAGAVSFGDDVSVAGALTVGGAAVPTQADAIAYALIFG